MHKRTVDEIQTEKSGKFCGAVNLLTRA